MIKRLALLLLALQLSAVTKAELMIEITQGMDNPAPIAIVPFAGTEGHRENIPDIVAADLQRSGFFRPIPKADMLSTPHYERDVFYRDWRILGAEFLVIGRLQAGVAAGTNPDQYVLEYALYDVLGQRNLFKKVAKGSTSELRDIAHEVSDAVYEAITGIRGAFSTKILYIEDLKRAGAGRYRLVTADADGARDKVLFSSSQPLLSPAWSSDLKQVAYVSFETTRPAIFRQNLLTGVREQLTNFQGLNGAPAWSPDNKKLALVLSKDGNPEVYTLDLATRQLTRVTRHFAIDTEPNWTADGKGLIFTSNRGGNPQIYQVGLETGRIERLTFEGDYNARPRVSPDGKSLVMVNRYKGVFHIAWQDIVSGDMRILTETWLDESPSIAPNGAMLLYATQHNNKGVLAAVSMDAGVKFRLPSKQGDVREPAWSPYVNK
ncbi:Tol-Pal system beta propeller repeat protein TolB [Teredinibacter franksiae]|uniref:Tol-Pal system beta propeller repeat protein TolB n=1 Tax=Teredinibacter franksiae TaxID=2761453 RepID=UPI001623DE2D|nr:Tol-Pal system beta propeller repeat protein TolB [Teredinibacter franksiae]